MRKRLHEKMGERMISRDRSRVCRIRNGSIDRVSLRSWLQDKWQCQSSWEKMLDWQRWTRLVMEMTSCGCGKKTASGAIVTVETGRGGVKPKNKEETRERITQPPQRTDPFDRLNRPSYARSLLPSRTVQKHVTADPWGRIYSLSWYHDKLWANF